MQEKLEDKLQELKELIEQDPIYLEAIELRDKLLKDSFLLKQLEQLKSSEDKYSSDYRTKKQNLYENKEYQRYQELETEIYRMVLAINQRFNQLTRKGACQK